MKEMSRYLLGVVTNSLRGGNAAKRPIFNRAIECTWAWFEFYMYAQYKSHQDATFSYMEDISKQYFRLGGIAPLQWTLSVRAIRYTAVTYYSVPGVNTIRCVPYRPLITV